MNSKRLVIQSIVYFWKRNTLLAIGFAISTAVLTGALIVGDSVKASLHEIASQRLGKVTVIMQSADRFFTEDLLVHLREDYELPVAGVLMLDAMAVADGGQKRINDIQLSGVDGYFDAMSPSAGDFASLAGDSVFISNTLSERLNLKIGDEFLLRITKASLVPLNAPFVSDAENTVTIRAYVSKILGSPEMGAFNLKTSQTAPFNVFISAAYLQEEMEIGQRFNVLLSSGENIDDLYLEDKVASSWSLYDAGLQIVENEKTNFLDLRSERVFIEDALWEAFEESELNVRPILTYFVNSIRHQQNSTPYSFVSTTEDSVLGPDEIIINKWLAEDLEAMPGDTVHMAYFVVGLLRELEQRDRSFIVESVVPLEGSYNDPDLMPDIPGMSDAGNCRDWETGVPIELEAIRDKDEDYWTSYRGTPKAFIASSTAVEMWKNRFGTYTSLRFDPLNWNPGARDASDPFPAADTNTSTVPIANSKSMPDARSTSFANAAVLYDLTEVLRTITPSDLGYEFRSVLDEALYAAENGVDFSELFGGLSFFLLAGAILMTILLFRLNTESRKEQVRILSVMGIPEKRILKIMIAEGFFFAIAGAVFGVFLALLYTSSIFFALNSIWMDIVRTSMLQIHIRMTSMLIGSGISILIAMLVMFLVLRRQLKKAVSSHIKKPGGKSLFVNKRLVSILAYTFGLGGIVILLFQYLSKSGINASLFFMAGGLFLISAVLFSYRYLLSFRLNQSSKLNLHTLSTKNAVNNLSRSMSIILLLTLGTFIVLSTGTNRKDLFANMEDPASGAGGFLYYAESTIPLLQNLKNDDARFSYGLSDTYSIFQMRISEGDDASCLNLNRITNPRILGVNPSGLEGRFSFITSIELLDKENPWNSLRLELEDDLIPAIADETVIKWGLGLKVGDTLQYQDARGDTLNLLLIGGLAPSVFQGSVLIDEKNFIRHFPSSSGSEVFLIEGNTSDSAMIKDELSQGMRDLGWSMELTGKRLTEFNSVTNTYLSIFMILGALGLLLATIGLSMVLFRSIFERKEELGILRASGFSLKVVKSLIMREYLLLLFLGTLSGALPALIATLPSFLSRNTEVSFLLIAGIVALLLINGIVWIWFVTTLALRDRVLVNALRND